MPYKCEMVQSKLYFAACFRREKRSWQSPVATNALEKIFTMEEKEMKIYNVLLYSTKSLSRRLMLSAAWNHRSQGAGRVIALLISAHTVHEGTALSVSAMLHSGNSARNIVPVALTPPAAHQSRQEQAGGNQTWSFCGERHLPPVPACGGDWMGSSHLLLHPPCISLDASPTSGITEPGLSQQQSFECGQLCCQHDWCSDRKLHFVYKRL